MCSKMQGMFVRTKMCRYFEHFLSISEFYNNFGNKDE